MPYTQTLQTYPKTIQAPRLVSEPVSSSASAFPSLSLGTDWPYLKLFAGNKDFMELKFSKNSRVVGRSGKDSCGTAELHTTKQDGPHPKDYLLVLRPPKLIRLPPYCLASLTIYLLVALCGPS
ncbi:hypothetical protein DPEC_G00018830 [Dallia pectoralis]|uniref:Uncharacterized protein n=1 Tax=Dallia pectoralis TaxID=75939 RepID=A0ACC2HFU5_DALPE|nr:hypothetical protein DPEC_G00018830 [Dallia pectoralis]